MSQEQRNAQASDLTQGKKEAEVGENSTATSTIIPVIAALIKSEDLLGPDRNWSPQNDKQALFLEKFFPKREELDAFLRQKQEDSPLKLDSVASYSANEINRFLKEKGFDIQVSDFSPPDFGVASVMEVLVKWNEEGQNSVLYVSGKEYPSVVLKSPPVQLLADVERISAPLVRIDTRNPDYTFNLIIPPGPVGDFELLHYIEEVKRDRESGIYAPVPRKYEVEFPKVDLDVKPDISWIEGMSARGEGLPGIIGQALQQTIFKLNEKGAFAKSGVSLMTMRSMPEPTPRYRIKEPFVCWIEKEGISLPVFAGFIGYKDWKDPGQLPE